VLDVEETAAPCKNFNDIKWQNLVFSLIKFENLQKRE